MIEPDFNRVGQLIFSCNHVKGYNKGKGKNLCRKCELKLLNKIQKILGENNE